MKALRPAFGRAAERATLRIGTALAVRPRRFVGLVFVLVALTVLMTPTAPAVADGKCGGGFSGALCEGAHSVGLGGLWDTADSTVKTINALSPQNFLDTWAQGLCSAVVFILAFIEATAEKLATPAYDQQWWADQYAVSFGLSLVVFAFLLLLVTAKISGSETPVSGVELLRQAGVRIPFVVPAIVAGPAVLYSVQQLAAELTKAFALESEKDGHGAIGALMKYLKAHAGNWGTFGGTIMVIFMMFFVLLTAIVLLIEVSVANWGLTMASLIVPFAIVAAAYPPWGRILKRLCVLIGTLMFTPVFTFFFFWTVWSAFNSLLTSPDSSNSGFSMVLFLLISLIMIDAFPLVAVWLLGLATPDSETMDADVKAMAPTPTGGEVYSKLFDRQFSQGSPGAGADPGGAGAAEATSADAEGEEPEVGEAPKSPGGSGEGGSPGDGGNDPADDGGEDGPSHGPDGGGSHGGIGGVVEHQASEGAQDGAQEGSEAGPEGAAIGAGVGAAKGTVTAVPDFVEGQSEQMMDSDGGAR